MNQEIMVGKKILNDNKNDMHLVNLLEYKDNNTSQYGENGIIEKIFEVIGTSNKVCVEFGGYDLEIASNIFPLWRHNGWHGIIIEGDKNRYKKMLGEFAKLYAPRDLSLKILNCWVEAQGINSLDEILPDADVPNNFDLCSIDVDSIDYHIWEGLTKYSPRVVMIEYNRTVPPHISLIGKKSGNYIGAGILDMMKLGNRKGYDLVACTEANAIFVIKEESALFMNRNNLEKLHNSSWLTYVISSFDGGILFSRKPDFGDVLTSRERFRINDYHNFYFPGVWNYFYKRIKYIMKYLTF